MKCARAWLATLALAAMVGGCARGAKFLPYAGAYPAPGAITAFSEFYGPLYRPETAAGAPAFLRPGTTNRRLHRVGTLVLPARAESVVVLVYGDNRPGLRMMTTAWGLPVVMDIGSPDPVRFLWAVANIPVMLIQAVFPRLDGFRDIVSLTWTHLYSGGNEKRVIEALVNDLPANFVVQTGDVVENGRRGEGWERFVKSHSPLRQRVPYLAAPGNHERTWSKEGRYNWDAVMGAPAEPLRYWFAVDLPDSLARFVFLDSELLADPRNHYPDSLERVLAGEQIAWADSALAVPARYKFLILHHPLVTSGHYLSDWKYDDSEPAEIRRRGRVLEMCRRRGVTAVLAGHEHLYQRTYVRGRDGRGFWHITTGGGGSPLYRLSEYHRKAALSVTLPDSSVVVWNRARSMYHYCRLVILRHPKPGQEGVTLEVNRVRSSGRILQIDRVNLKDVPTEEKRERVPGARAAG
jgi:calcineurin-like phosphoesterase family protein